MTKFKVFLKPSPVHPLASPVALEVEGVGANVDDFNRLVIFEEDHAAVLAVSAQPGAVAVKIKAMFSTGSWDYWTS